MVSSKADFVLVGNYPRFCKVSKLCEARHQNFIINSSASTVLMIWLSLILNLFKEIVSFNSKYFNLSVLIFASGGLLHLLVLPIVTGTLNVSRFLPYIKFVAHSSAFSAFKHLGIPKHQSQRGNWFATGTQNGGSTS